MTLIHVHGCLCYVTSPVVVLGAGYRDEGQPCYTLYQRSHSTCILSQPYAGDTMMASCEVD